jgi:hypothetical protein
MGVGLDFFAGEENADQSLCILVKPSHIFIDISLLNQILRYIHNGAVIRLVM